MQAARRLAAVVVVALSVVLAAREANQPQPTFRMVIDYVTTDAIARNARGQFVANLTKADFEVFEDGVRQAIASLTLVQGGRVHNPGRLRSLFTRPLATAKG